MLEVIRNTFKNPELRAKILFTVLILVIFRVGNAIQAPFIDASKLMDLTGDGGNFFGYMNMLSGGAFTQASIFALSISPYITSSIIMQLLTIAIPALERMSKDGGEGRKKINQITRYVTVGYAIVQAIGYYLLMRNSGAIDSKYLSGGTMWFVAITIVLVFTAGASLIMWLGEQINEKGIGNGISMILFAGIISRAPSAFKVLYENFVEGSANYLLVPLIVLIFIFMIVFIIIMTNAERRIPVQYAKRSRSKKENVR